MFYSIEVYSRLSASRAQRNLKIKLKKLKQVSGRPIYEIEETLEWSEPIRIPSPHEDMCSITII